LSIQADCRTSSPEHLVAETLAEIAAKEITAELTPRVSYLFVGMDARRLPSLDSGLGNGDNTRSRRSGVVRNFGFGKEVGSSRSPFNHARPAIAIKSHRMVTPSSPSQRLPHLFRQVFHGERLLDEVHAVVQYTPA
jgi:hypothetical protein